MRFTYNYNFVSDTLVKETISREPVVLDYNHKEQRSVFAGLKHIVSDSAMSSQSQKGIMAFPDGSSKIINVVEKINNANSIYFYTPNHMPYPVLKVEDKRRMKWEIMNDHENILGNSAQKATTYFAGRQWTAWFTPEIPISDGPYKFCGLPGLIVKLTDKTNTHSFEIIAIEKQKSNYFILNDETYKNAKKITFKEYEKVPRNHFELFKMKILSEGIFNSNDEKQKFLKEADDKIHQSKIHENNPLEVLNKKP